MSRIRTFIAIDVDKTIRNRLVALQEALAEADSDVRWVAPENMHVTLLFLGEVDEREIHKVCRAVAVVCQAQEPFAMSIEHTGCFPNARRPRVLWAGVGEGAEAIGKLHDDLEPPLLELGCYRREDRKYTPHLTLGRVEGDRATDPLVQALTRKAAWHGGQTLVREVHVMSSQMSSGGPTYAVMSRAKLGQNLATD